MAGEAVQGLAELYAMFGTLPDAANEQLGVELAIIGRDILALQQIAVPKDTGALEGKLTLALAIDQLRVRVGLLGIPNSRTGKVFLGKAPAVTLGLIPATTVALAQLLDPSVQGSTVTIAMGCVDIATGTAVSAPYVLFTGELDVPSVTWDANDRRLEYKVTSVAERLFNIEEGRRLSDAFHQKVWPGELGLAFVTDVETYVPWGQKLDTTAIETRTNIPSYGNITNART